VKLFFTGGNRLLRSMHYLKRFIYAYNESNIFMLPWYKKWELIPTICSTVDPI